MHSSRLKRKLNDLGVNTASSKVNENFCLIGTPLPLLEKSKDTGEFVPLWKQEVRDEKGRRRLHGAFTGGFSAGYFNTVGSKEGWTPSTFSSSRSDRAKQKAVRPEDFMDEEDLAELRESKKLVDTTEEMDLDFWERRKKVDDGDEDQDSITKALQSALLPTPRDSVGARILKKMGWRPGQGIGPKITYEQRKKQDALASAPLGPSDDFIGAEDHEEAKRHLYPQRDTKVAVIKKKEDVHGLGYVSGLSLTDMISDEAKKAGGAGGPNISSGFGLGALNDADEDDLDVYDSGLSKGSRRVAYEGDDNDDRIIMGSRNKLNRNSGQTARPGPSNSSQGRQQGQFDIITFKNGSRVLPGFVISKAFVDQDIRFPLPKVPEGWTPNPRRVWEQDKENLKDGQNGIEHPASKGTYRGRLAMTADQRGAMLGETPLPSAPRSVFEYLAPKDRNRLQGLASGSISSEESSEPGLALASEEPSIPQLDPQVAKMALQGFQPFTNDPVKQARYTAFLKARAAGEDELPFSRTPGQKADEFAKELADYAKSAQIFKPVSTAMAGRFTSASVVEAGPQTAEGLHRPLDSSAYLSRPTFKEKEEEKKEESPKENAARLGMFGPLTREVKPWMPAKLLCKRFGVKEPVVETIPETQSGAAPSTSAAPGASWESGGVLAITDGSAGTTDIKALGEEVGSSSSKSGTAGRRDIANIGLGEDESQSKDILTYQRPARDIFKAIFASDEEDEGDDDEDIKSVNEQPATSSANGTVHNLGPVEPESVKDVSLLASTSSVTPYEPGKVNGTINEPTGIVDLASFKPTFVPRAERLAEREKGEKGKSDKKHKDKKKKGKVLVSFEVDEEGSGDESKLKEKDKERDKGKRKKKRKEGMTKKEEDEESMWVEKPPPEAVQNLPAHEMRPVVDPSADWQSDPDVKGIGPPRGRKRAVDFM